jgi:signal transduction histidine kinase
MAALPRDWAFPRLEVLRVAWDELGMARDVAEAASAATSMIRAAVGQDATVGLWQPDAAGRLRMVWRAGDDPISRRGRSERRRAASGTLRSCLVGLPDTEGRALGTISVACGGSAFGVLEIVASEAAICAAWTAMEFTSSQLALTLRNLAERAQLRDEVETCERTSRLGIELVRAPTPEAAVRIAVRFFFERFGVPVAGWSLGADGSMHLTGTRGMAHRKREGLRLAVPEMNRWASLGPSERRAVGRRFERATGVREAMPFDIGDAVLFVGNPTERTETALDVVGPLLGEVLRLVAIARLADRRNEELDMGIAWTAHELRGPLLGMRAVLELVERRRDADPRERAVVRRSLSELDRLVSTSDALLAWAVGARPLRRRPTDLVRIVEQALESIRLETGTDKIVVRTPPQAIARLDAAHVRAVVANLVRNALAYGHPRTKIEVTVEEEGDQLMLSVTDEGPAVPDAERFAIFDPFVRGDVSGAARSGSGLGLFIARRVVDAHGGRIWVESDCGATTFRVALPVGGRERRFAS